MGALTMSLMLSGCGHSENQALDQFCPQIALVTYELGDQLENHMESTLSHNGWCLLSSVPTGAVPASPRPGLFGGTASRFATPALHP